jgi:putative ATP-binding cassette transporter
VELFFLPQQAFLLSNSTLFEQLAFPEALEQNGQRAIATPRDLEFAKIAMGSAFAEMIVQLLGGWDSPAAGFGSDEDLTYPWESLSGGQQQKVAIARLFFRAQVLREQGKSCFAMLDESTSQIDADSEDIIFTKLRAFGITHVSVTHRERVIAHHTHALVLQPNRKSYNIRKVRKDMPSRSESGTQLVDW